MNKGTNTVRLISQVNKWIDGWMVVHRPENSSHSSPLRRSGIPLRTSSLVLEVRYMQTPRPNSEKWMFHASSFIFSFICTRRRSQGEEKRQEGGQAGFFWVNIVFHLITLKHKPFLLRVYQISDSHANWPLREERPAGPFLWFFCDFLKELSPYSFVWSGTSGKVHYRSKQGPKIKRFRQLEEEFFYWPKYWNPGK